MKNSNLPSIKETIRLSLRCIRDVGKCCPGLLASFLITDFVLVLTPYVTIWLSARIINELAGRCRAKELWHLVVITILLEALLGILSAFLKHWKRSQSDLYEVKRRRIYSDKMLDMDYADIDKHENRELLGVVLQNEITMAFGMGKVIYWAESIYQAILRIIGAVALTVSLFILEVPEEKALAFLNHPVFAVLLLLLIFGTVYLIRMIGKRDAKLHDDAYEIQRHASLKWNVFGERFISHKHAMDMRLYKLHDLIEKYNKESDHTLVYHFHPWYKGKLGIMRALTNNLPTLIMGVVYVFVCLKALGGAFGIGSVTQYVGAVTKLTQGISDLAKNMEKLRGNAIYLRSTYKLLDLPNSMYRGTLPTEKRDDREYEVEFDNVSFKYPGSDIWALRHVNIKFKIGSRLAIVGENGSGKTTFIKLLCRLYDPQEGEIRLNDIDIRKYKYEDYLNVFAVVFQDFQLLSQPLGANVAGGVEYDRERVVKALEDAGFGERLRSLQEGLDTQIYNEFGVRGIEVSGGEAQKIAIARALYKDAPFIILDEPTAALDPIAEAEVYSKFNEISGDKTAIYISHRLSSCKFCDEIAVFHEGRVVQKGTHEELLADSGGKYQELWNAQAQYYTT